MKFRNAALITLLAIVASCGQPTGSKLAAPADCSTFSYFMDAAWTTQYVRNFLRCMGKKEDIFPATVGIIDTMGESGFQAFLDLLRWDSSTQKAPLLRAAATILDRGTQLSDGKDIVNEQQRWQNTQPFLMASQPQAFMQLLLELQRQGLLEESFDALGLIDTALPGRFTSTMFLNFLENPTTKADVRSLLNGLLKNPTTYAALKRWIKADPFPIAGNIYPGSGESRGAMEHWKRLWATLDAGQQQRLQKVFGQVMSFGLASSDGNARSHAIRMGHALESSFFRSKNAAQQTGSLLQAMLQTPAADLDPLIKGLLALRNRPEFFEPLQEKLGSAYVQNQLISHLWYGIQPAGCTQVIPGLKDAGGALQQRLEDWLNPHAACSGKVPLMALLMTDYMGYECPADICNKSLAPAASYNGELKSLANYAWTRLQRDPWLLYTLGAARNVIDASTSAAIRSEFDNRSLQSIDDLISLERDLAGRESLGKILSKDWLEIWLQHSLLELSSIEDRFQKLYPNGVANDPTSAWAWYASSDADKDMAAIVLGLFPRGLGEVELDRMFALNPVKAAWLQRRPNSAIDNKDLAMWLSGARNVYTQYSNPKIGFKPEAKAAEIKWLGSESNRPTYSATGQRQASTAKFDTSLLHGQGDQGFALRARLKNQLRLASASLPLDEANEFHSWFFDVWIPQKDQELTARSLTTEPWARGALFPVDLFDRDALPVKDLRMFAHFIAGQTIEPKIPDGALISAAAATDKTQAPRTFAGPAMFGNAGWTSLWAFDSGFLDASRGSMQDILNAVETDEAKLNAFFATRIQTPLIVTSTGINAFEIETMDAHEKLLLQLHLASPFARNKTSSFFTPSLSYGAHCPKLVNNVWTPSACPFQVKNFAEYRGILRQRIQDSLCTFMPREAVALEQWRSRLQISDSAGSLLTLCQGVPSREGTWLQALAENVESLGKNPRLKENLKQVNRLMHMKKASQLPSAVQAYYALLQYTPILNKGVSSHILQIHGTTNPYGSGTPTLIPSLLLQIHQRIGEAVVVKKLTAYGAGDIGGKTNPLPELFDLLSQTYAAAKTSGQSSLAFFFNVLRAIQAKPYLQETLYRLMAHPGDFSTASITGYVLPQAADPSMQIFDTFTWDRYRLMRLFLQAENQYLTQNFLQVYGVEIASWLDFTKRVMDIFPDVATFERDMRPLLTLMTSALSASQPELSKNVMRSAPLADVMAAATGVFGTLNLTLANLDNTWETPYAQQTEALAGGFLQLFPRLWTLGERVSNGSSQTDLLADASLGFLQPALNADSKELIRLMQDSRLGLRGDLFWFAAMRDPSWRSKANATLGALQRTQRRQWQASLDEWLTIGPEFSKTMSYVADNTIWKDPDDALRMTTLVLADTLRVPLRWDLAPKVCRAWLDDRHPLQEFQR